MTIIGIEHVIKKKEEKNVKYQSSNVAYCSLFDVWPPAEQAHVMRMGSLGHWENNSFFIFEIKSTGQFKATFLTYSFYINLFIGV